MGFLYPDNKNRANRVNQLAEDIARLQTEVKEDVEDAKTQDKRAVEILEQLAKKHGFKTLEEYIEHAEKQLSPEDRKKYQDMKKELENTDEALDISMKVAGGLLGVAFTSGLAVAATKFLFQRNMVAVSLRAITVGLVKVLGGHFDDGIAIFRSASKVLSNILKGEALAGKVVKVVKFLKVAGKVLSVLGIIFEGILLIYEAIDGAQQRAEFQQAIKDLCVRRLVVKKIQQYARVTLLFASDAKAIADYADSLQDFVGEGLLEQDVVDKKVSEKMGELEPKITKAVEGVDDNSVYNMLRDQDKESQVAWTNEDPSLAEMLQMIEDGDLGTRAGHNSVVPIAETNILSAGGRHHRDHHDDKVWDRCETSKEVVVTVRF